MGKGEIDIAEIFSARYVYLEKAKMFVRMHGDAPYGDGGEPHDVMNVLKKYGAMPQSVYNGLNYGTKYNSFDEIQAGLKGFIDGIVKQKKLTPNWEKAFSAIEDSYFGAVPETFYYNGKRYTPRSYADEVIGINPNDYIEMVSTEYQPKYEKVHMDVQDNWSHELCYNVEMNDITVIMDNALKNGFTIAWATDMSEKYFSWRNGVAFVPEKDFADMTEEERKTMFDNPPAKERVITPELRAKAFENWETTDDHVMHIVGMAKDQTGRDYYIVKNSWGESNDYKGYLYVSKAFVNYKTTTFMVHKDAMPKAIMNKFKK